jgi:hypothetical protein
MNHLDPSAFKKMFWMDQATFDELLEIMFPHLTCRDSIKAAYSSGSCILPKTRLAVSIHWLAGASHIDLCFAWGIAHSTFFSHHGALWPTIEAIDDAFQMGFPVNDRA